MENFKFLIVVFALYVGTHIILANAIAQETSQEAEPEASTPEVLEGTMTLERINTIITRIDETATQPKKGLWNFKVNETTLIIVTDETNDRMRIVIPIKSADELTKAELLRIAQANFDSALDARYAVAQGALWAVYIHPLRTLHDKQFISAIAQTVTTSLNYGKSYSSGAFVFGGGDSQGIIKDELIERLKKKGLAI